MHKKQSIKLLVLGIDAALPDLLKKFKKEGSIPNLAKLMDNGFFSRVITTFPPLTAAAWAAIVTGAGPGTCGIPSLMVKLAGEELNMWHTSFDKRMLEAETLWEAENKVGRCTALINWPVTWPKGIENVNNGIQIASSLNPPFRFFYMPLWDIASSSLFSSDSYACNQVPGRAVVVNLEQAIDWIGLPKSKFSAKQFQIEVPPVYAKGVKYNVTIVSDNGQGYNKIIICRDKDASKAVTVLREKEWSDWIEENFINKDGELKRGRFRFYVPELTKDVKHFRLFASAINTAEDYTFPVNLKEKIIKTAGTYMEVDDPWAYMDGWVELDTYIDQLQQHVNWWSNTTKYVLENEDKDSVFSWVGVIDHIQHVLYGGIDPKSKHYKKEDAPKWMNYIRRVYQQVDEGVGNILKAVNLDETLIVVVSDHGFSSIEWNPYLKLLLKKAGLLSYTLNPQTGEMIVDWSKTKCFPLEPCHAHIFINLKGREPRGIVEPEDYEKVQQEIIEALMDIKDPETDECIVDLALKKQQAGTLGIFESKCYDRIGDVLFALKPEYMANPFVYQAVVKYFDGTERKIANIEEFEPAVITKNFTGAHLALPWDNTMHASLILTGAEIKPIERKQPVNIIDIAPTISKILGIPVPKDAEGNSLDEIVNKVKKRENN